MPAHERGAERDEKRIAMLAKIDQTTTLSGQRACERRHSLHQQAR